MFYITAPARILIFQVMSVFVGEGNEEIGNMIQNYIKEIEELRYSFYFIVIF